MGSPMALSLRTLPCHSSYEIRSTLVSHLNPGGDAQFLLGALPIHSQVPGRGSTGIWLSPLGVHLLLLLHGDGFTGATGREVQTR